MIVPGAYRAPSVMHRIFFNLAIGNGTKDSKDQSDRSKSAHNAITQINSGCDLDYRDNFYDQHVPLSKDIEFLHEPYMEAGPLEYFARMAMISIIRSMLQESDTASSRSASNQDKTCWFCFMVPPP